MLRYISDKFPLSLYFVVHVKYQSWAFSTGAFGTQAHFTKLDFHGSMMDLLSTPYFSPLNTWVLWYWAHVYATEQREGRFLKSLYVQLFCSF